MKVIRHYLRILGRLFVDHGKQAREWGDRSRHRLYASRYDDLLS